MEGSDYITPRNLGTRGIGDWVGTRPSLGVLGKGKISCPWPSSPYPSCHTMLGQLHRYMWRRPLYWMKRRVVNWDIRRWRARVPLILNFSAKWRWAVWLRIWRLYIRSILIGL